MEGKPSIFRKEALDYYQLHRRHEGDVLRVAPRWTRWAYPLLMGLVALVLVFSAVGSVSEYATGPALIRVERRVRLTAPETAVVTSVAVRPGQHVAPGQVLMSLQPEAELRELTRLQREVDLQRLRTLEAPSDWAARQTLRRAHDELDQALARAEARVIRAPVAGVVGASLGQPGQVVAGDGPLATLVEEGAQVSLLAFLPAHYRPLLRPGLNLRVTLEGFHHEAQEVAIESVGDEALGPEELQRLLGPGLAGAVGASGPLVVVRARLPSRTFSDRGHARDYVDGMPARVKAAVRSEPILATLVPGLKGLLSHDG
ncbi:HlyD family efflux transporter periplasmic adaptor subunit [Corallococcus sp. CA053C]|uniref:efflux RND transporter periplasmic adaptor subunit n=1 Tax=Corallococcus sp. CA053C TaxID=2316732 RepID=UPI000EA19489|nr:HlyD family efflux transporter periplasmic adaptor subunit [Corallococcus sp. CA053C]RKH08232.1 HlyD family efflux transporter periplasmic adaptor subunit [Corallococcus sp. CA053C]